MKRWKCALEIGHRLSLFSRDEATLYERVSVRRLVRPLVGALVSLSLFGLLGATYAVYSALLINFHHFGILVKKKTVKDQTADRPMDMPSYREARTHLKKVPLWTKRPNRSMT